MQLTIRQHYVPRVYLRGWSDPDGKLKVHEKAHKREFYAVAENVCLEKYYYEDPNLPPTNDLEQRFGAYEGAFGFARDFLVIVKDTARTHGQPVAETVCSALMARPERANALKDFAGTAYFRTPGALKAMREQLAADQSPAAASALEAMNSPHALSMHAFESTLLERFRRLHIVLLHTEERVDTSDRSCFPVAGGTGHANFAYDIGRYGAAVAVMPVTPELLSNLVYEERS